MLVFAGSADAGVHYSADPGNPLPARWRGFLTDHRALRLLALPPLPDTPRRLSLVHDAYADALARLEGVRRTRPLTADEAADLGAVFLRTGKPEKAVEVLRAAARTHPSHFALAANLGTAWHLSGDLTQAAAALDTAATLAPPRWKPFEQAHRKLVRLRMKESKGATGLDDLFGVAFPGVPGKAVQLPADAAAVAQQLALWLPADGRLLWQLAEVANATGDVRTAAAILDGCVTEFGMKDATLRARRQTYRAAVDAADAANDHTRFTPTLTFRSARPLASALDPAKLPAIDPAGVTDLPWVTLTETTVGRRFPPTYLDFVSKLDGKRVAVVGFAKPAGDGLLLSEFPVGCWFCESPDPTGLVAVELATPVADPGRGPVRVEGVFKLNRTDPEGHLFTLTGAKLKPAD